MCVLMFGHVWALHRACPTTGVSMVCFSTEPSLLYSEEYNKLSALVIEEAALVDQAVDLQASWMDSGK